MFDCCRAEFTPPTRGGVNNDRCDDDIDVDESRDCILIFGCRPLSEVSAVSTVALEFIERLEQCARPDGSIVFPSMEFFTWTPGDNGEFLPMFKRELLFRPPTN